MILTNKRQRTKFLLKYRNRIAKILPKFDIFPGFYLIVVLPVLIASIYYGFIASDIYVSETKFIIKQNKSSGMSYGSLSLLGGVSDGTQQDAHLIKEYILSYDMLSHLDRLFELKKRYQTSPKIDRASRLAEKTSTENFLSYYRNLVAVDFDETSSIVTVRMKDFNPFITQEILGEILKKGEDFINNISHKLASSQLTFINKEVQGAKEQLQNAQERLTRFQDKHIILSPREESESISAAISNMEGALMQEEANLKGLRSYLNSRAHEVVSSNNKIRALKRQISQERRKLVGNEKGNKLNVISSDFEKLSFEVSFLTDAYKTALSSLEAARLEALRQLKYLIHISKPTLPEEATYPRKSYILLTLFLICTLFYGILRLIVATIKDHKDF
ncbi:MAG: sugar transporter [Alphaproteobacteria bacterium]